MFEILHRIDASKNMRRFYQVNVERDLLGDVVVTRRWGRIGTDGQRRVEVHADMACGIRRCGELVDGKLRRGYACPNSIKPDIDTSG